MPQPGLDLYQSCSFLYLWLLFFFFFSPFSYDLRSTTVNKATPRRGFSGVEAGMETKTMFRIHMEMRVGAWKARPSAGCFPFFSFLFTVLAWRARRVGPPQNRGRQAYLVVVLFFFVFLFFPFPSPACSVL